MIAISQEDFDALEGATEQDLLGQLGLAVTGSDGADQGSSLKGLRTASAALAWPNFIQIGINFFNHIWPSVKDIVCQGYEAYTADDKEWIERAATAVLGLVNVGSAIAILIVKIAIKKGLDALCAV